MVEFNHYDCAVDVQPHTVAAAYLMMLPFVKCLETYSARLN